MGSHGKFYWRRGTAKGGERLASRDVSVRKEEGGEQDQPFMRGSSAGTVATQWMALSGP